MLFIKAVVTGNPLRILFRSKEMSGVRAEQAEMFSAARDKAVTSQAGRTNRWTFFFLYNFLISTTPAHDSVTSEPVKLRSCPFGFGYIHIPFLPLIAF